MNRCCGRCDGLNDICIADKICEIHGVQGCEICYGPRCIEKYITSQARNVGNYSDSTLKMKPFEVLITWPDGRQEKVNVYLADEQGNIIGTKA